MDENKETGLRRECFYRSAEVCAGSAAEEAAGLSVKKCMFYSPIIRFKPVI